MVDIERIEEHGKVSVLSSFDKEGWRIRDGVRESLRRRQGLMRLIAGCCQVKGFYAY